MSFLGKTTENFTRLSVNRKLKWEYIIKTNDDDDDNNDNNNV